METKTSPKEQMALNFDNIGEPTNRHTDNIHILRRTRSAFALGQGNCKLKLEFDLELDTGWSNVTHEVPLQSRVELVICMYVRYDYLWLRDNGQCCVSAWHQQVSIVSTVTENVQRVERFL